MGAMRAYGRPEIGATPVAKRLPIDREPIKRVVVKK